MGWTLILAVIAFAAAMFAMAVGVIFSNRKIRGSCGGLANLRDSQGRIMCDACTDPAPDCTGVEDGQQRESSSQSAE